MFFRNNPDIKRFEEIVDLYQDRLFRFAFIRVGVRETAEDLVQEVLIRLYKTMLEGKEIVNPEFFLLRCLGNACIDHLRRKRPPTIRVDEIGEIADEKDRDIDVEFLRVSRLLDGLPSEQAETVRLKSYDGLTFRQIAELQDISESTVKSRYRYAIIYLRDKLNR